MTREEALAAARKAAQEALDATRSEWGAATAAYQAACRAADEAVRARAEASSRLDAAQRAHYALGASPLLDICDVVRMWLNDGRSADWHWHRVIQNGPKRALVSRWTLDATSWDGARHAALVHPDDRCVLRVFGPGGALAHVEPLVRP